MKQQPYVLQLVGYSNSGKTTLLTKLIPLFEQSGLRVGVVKHDGGHDFEVDQPGKDTWRYREAGATLVAITSATKTAIVDQRPTPLPELVERLTQAVSRPDSRGRLQARGVSKARADPKAEGSRAIGHADPDRGGHRVGERHSF